MVSALASAWRAWERFLFASNDAATLAVLRIVFGAYLFFYYVDLLPFLQLNHFPPALLTPQSLQELPAWVLFKYVRHGTFERTAVYALTLLSALALAAGLQTRVAALMCWLLNQAWMSMPAGRNSGDNAVSVACFLFLVVAFSGHAARVYSCDAALRRARVDARIPSWPLRLFQVQLALIYFFSGFHKLAAPDWYTGEALFYVAQQRGWARGDWTGLTHPLLVGGLSYGTLFFELLIFPVLVWNRALRPYVLGAGLLFHVGIAASMRVFVFGEIMPLLYLAFLSTRPWVVQLGRLPLLRRLRRTRPSAAAIPAAAAE